MLVCVASPKPIFPHTKCFPQTRRALIPVFVAGEVGAPEEVPNTSDKDNRQDKTLLASVPPCPKHDGFCQ